MQISQILTNFIIQYQKVTFTNITDVFFIVVIKIVSDLGKQSLGISGVPMILKAPLLRTVTQKPWLLPACGPTNLLKTSSHPASRRGKRLNITLKIHFPEMTHTFLFVFHYCKLFTCSHLAAREGSRNIAPAVYQPQLRDKPTLLLKDVLSRGERREVRSSQLECSIIPCITESPGPK